MTDQRPHGSPHRLFVAAYPPASVVDELAALPRPAEPGVRWVPSERWHVTLRFLGATDPEPVAARLGSTVLPGATAVLGPAVSRLGPDVVVVPVAGLDALSAAVIAATADLGEPADPRPFVGHLTLARLRRRAACGLAGAPVHGSFPVDEVCLVDSRSVGGALRYDVLARFPTSLSRSSGPLDQM